MYRVCLSSCACMLTCHACMHVHACMHATRSKMQRIHALSVERSTADRVDACRHSMAKSSRPWIESDSPIFSAAPLILSHSNFALLHAMQNFTGSHNLCTHAVRQLTHDLRTTLNTSSPTRQVNPHTDHRWTSWRPLRSPSDQRGDVHWPGGGAACRLECPVASMP
jgi:hypothetical protein